ncbi:class I SAM-dependent methyltransferase [Brevundimonas balnearis]|uniref:Class I SAM-dependent methyltransferase n=1 Tax=Brevundimonas balnearis TaxID=1572858 RepID=A0ABV6R256_9CAUL
MPTPDALTRAASAVVDLYRDGAADYVARRTTTLFERPWLDRFLALAPDGPVLDLGCGFGEPVARYLIARGRRVIGVDASAALLDHARAAWPNQTWVEADMRAFTPGAPVAAVIAWHSLFHLRPAQQAELIARIGGWLVEGGVAMFTSGDRADERLGDWNGVPLYHASLDPGAYAAALARGRLRVVEQVTDDASAGNATIWLARKGG